MARVQRVVDVPEGCEVVIYEKSSGRQVPQHYSGQSYLPAEPPPQLSFGGVVVLAGILGIAYLCYRCCKKNCTCD